MTGSMMMLLGATGGMVTNPLNASASNSAAGSGSSTAGITFQSNGTMTGSASYSGPSNWYTPTITSIGAQYWININSGGWLSLSGGQATSLSGTNATSARTVQIATDAAGVNIVASGTLTLTVSNGS